MKLTPAQFLILGFLLVTYGMVVPFLMVFKYLEATFFWSFTSFAATFTGLLFGVVGISTYYREHHRRD